MRKSKNRAVPLWEAKTKPCEAKRLKPIAVSNLNENREGRSHGDKLVVKSVDYGDCRAVFPKVASNRDALYCRFGRARPERRN